MKKLYLVPVILILFFTAAYCAQENTDANTWDFGRVKEGEVLKHTFIFKNESKEILKIKDVATSCGCTASEVEKKVLMPQESTVINVTFNSKGYFAGVQQFIYLFTDSLDASTSLSVNGEYKRTIDNPVIKFIIKAQVQE